LLLEPRGELAQVAHLVGARWGVRVRARVRLRVEVKMRVK